MRQRQNLGRARSREFEIEVSARLGERLTLTGGYPFADARSEVFGGRSA